MKVAIEVTRETRYCTIVEMSEEDYKEYERQLYNGTRQENESCEEKLNEMIDVHDWQDDELKRVESFEPV